MNEKIVNLIEINKDLNGEILPIERESIFSDLGKIPLDIAQEYSKLFGDYIEDLLQIRNIISLSNKSNLAKHLIDGLTEVQLNRLKKIVMGLQCTHCEKMLDYVIAETLQIQEPEEVCLERTKQLINLVKEITIEHGEEKEELLSLSKTLKTFSNFLYTIQFMDKFEDLLIARMALMPLNELDWFIKTIKQKIANDDG